MRYSEIYQSLMELYLIWHFVTFLIGFVHTLGVRNLSLDGVAGVERHGDTDGDIHVLGSLDRDLVTDLLGHQLTPWLVTVMRGDTVNDRRSTPDATLT